MVDMIITGLTIIAIGLSAIYGFKIENSSSIFDIDRTYAFDFLFSIIIIFVHVPSLFQNAIQDLIGSFAYVGVSFFCMKAAYGVKYSYSHKRDYLKRFWKSRLFKICIPLLIVAMVDFIRCFLFENFSDFCLIQYDSIYGWIRVLLLFYVEFYLIYTITDKLRCPSLIKYRDVLLSVLIILQSIVDYSCHLNLIQGWYIERIGFVLGIVLFNHGDAIKFYIKEKYNLKLIGNLVITLVLGLLYIKFKHYGFVGEYLLRGFLELSFLILIVSVMQILKFDNRITQIGGGISYGIYICHPLVFTILSNCFRTVSSGLFIVLTVICTLCLAYIVTNIARIVAVRAN